MCQLHRTALASLIFALGAVPAAAAPPAGAAPVIGDFAYDRALHTGGAGDLDPLPIETSEDLDWMIHDSRVPALSASGDRLAQHIERSPPFRLAHRLGTDEIVVKLWTLHL